MPIMLPHSITALTEKEFHQLDYEIMALAFEAHNELGRFYDEQIYQSELERKCIGHGLETKSEFEARLVYKDYIKPLFIDLLIENSVYELKTIQSIQQPQRTQTLNYLFATNTRHGKIINYRPVSVESEFASTTLDETTRKQISIQCGAWQTFSDAADHLKTNMEGLLKDWGAFFDSHIYEEALIHFLGGKEKIVQPVEISTGNHLLGQQKLNAISDTETFFVSAARSNMLQHKNHLEKLLSHTPFHHLYWINLNRSNIQFMTLEK